MSDAAVDAARKLLRELDDAMKSPRGDYYQGDIMDPHRTLHIVAKHIAAHTADITARLASAEEDRDQWIEVLRKKEDEFDALKAALQGLYECNVWYGQIDSGDRARLQKAKAALTAAAGGRRE